jgi:dTDP-4-dehydrorhamnose 3,5-epimerase-like enzyme
VWTDPTYHDDAGHFVERDAVTVDPDNLIVPFDVARVYFLYGTTPGTVRGKHAHRTLRQLATCPVGSCVIDFDNGERKWAVQLNHPTKGALIEPGQWHELRDFSADCVVTVLADQPYDESDYIRDYAEFVAAD